MQVYDNHVGRIAKIGHCGFEIPAGWVGFWSFPIVFQVLHYTVNTIFTPNQGFTKCIYENQVLKADLHWASFSPANDKHFAGKCFLFKVGLSPSKKNLLFAWMEAL